MKVLSILGSGFLFAAGLTVAGMTQPEKVIGFLDFFGDWDPSLAFVMAGAILVHFPAYIYIKRRTHPLLAGAFSVPTRKDIDLRLLSGAALFGIGWGLGGYCPGPAVTALSSLSPSALIFLPAMLLGMLLFRFFDQMLAVGAKKRAVVRALEVEVQSG